MYDFANRLKTINNQLSVSGYQYNGLGDRLQETISGGTTTFTMDLNMGLTQALSDGTNTYIYGIDRIAQAEGTDTEYFLGDALGSVRQLTDTGGAVTYASAYDPYGVTTQAYGASQTAYGYTGEFTSNDMVYLRARHYAPGMGRFFTKDTWQGDVDLPMSFNHWSYVNNNPINYFDPTGHILETEQKEANQIVRELQRYSVYISVDWGYHDWAVGPASIPSVGCSWKYGAWTLNELKIVKGAVLHLDNVMNHNMANTIGAAYITRSKDPCGRGCTKGNLIELVDKGLKPWQMPGNDLVHYYVTKSSINFDQWTVVHELAHVWDNRYSEQLSKRLEEVTGGGTATEGQYCPVYDPNNELPGCNDARYFYGGIPPKTSSIGFNRREDFAESVAAYVFPDEAFTEIIKQLAQYKSNSKVSPYLYRQYEEHLLYYTDFRTTPRGRYIADIIRK